MKFVENLKKKKADNKGFSLVELIIVIAIMAILVGIVGTQVIPYLNKSREAKDLQILNSYSTAAVTAYSENAESITTGVTLEVDVYNPATGEATTLADEIKTLVGYSSVPASKMSSSDGKDLDKIVVEYNFTTSDVTVDGVTCEAGSVTVIAYDSTGAVILDQVTSYL